MRLSPPKFATFLISAALFLLALFGHFGLSAAMANYAAWLFIAAWVLLALSVVLKDL